MVYRINMCPVGDFYSKQSMHSEAVGSTKGFEIGHRWRLLFDAMHNSSKGKD